MCSWIGWSGGVGLALASVSCSGQHDRLAATEAAATTTSVASSSSGSTGGQGGAGAESSTSSLISMASTGGAGGDPRPPGPTELTVLDGVADFDAIRLCFLGYPGGENGGSAPWPADPEGLAFAHARVVDPIASALPADVDVRPWVLAGDLSQIGDKTCAELVAAPGDPDGAPPLVAAPLAVLPAAVFTSEKSLLLVPNGCLGGPDHIDGLAKLACGMTYGPSSPTAGLVVAPMSRKTSASFVGLQVVHASVPMPVSDVRVLPAQGSPETPVAPALSLGAIGPTPPLWALPSAAFEVPGGQLRTYAPADVYPTSAVLLSDVFASSDVAPEDFDDGQGFVFVAVGGYPGVTPSAWWHGYTYGLVRSDPTTSAD